MIENKADFVNKYLPESVREFSLSQIILDTSDLSISDVLRNLNKEYPLNSRKAFDLKSGEFVIGVMCRTVTVEPFSGILIIVAKRGMSINIVSSKFIVLVVPEDCIRSEDAIRNMIDKITAFIVSSYKDDLYDLPSLHAKFIYNETELFEDGYITETY